MILWPPSVIARSQSIVARRLATIDRCLAALIHANFAKKRRFPAKQGIQQPAGQTGAFMRPPRLDGAPHPGAALMVTVPGLGIQLLQDYFC